MTTFGPGDLVSHLDFPEFRGRIETFDNGKAKVEVLDGWKGPLPLWPVGIPTNKLTEVNHATGKT